MAEWAADDLPQVAQYLAVNSGKVNMLNQFVEFVHDKLFSKYQADLENAEAYNIKGYSLRERLQILHKMISAIGKLRCAEESNPYRILAKLPVEVYITVTPGNLMYDALEDASLSWLGNPNLDKRHPVRGICKWHVYEPSPDDDEESDAANEIGDALPIRYEPSLGKPLVYQLYGSLTDPASIIFSEDDYFRYLYKMGQTSCNSHVIPDVVKQALTQKSLMFLGFQLTDWSFRVLLKIIESLEGGTALQNSDYLYAEEYYPRCGANRPRRRPHLRTQQGERIPAKLPAKILRGLEIRRKTV